MGCDAHPPGPGDRLVVDHLALVAAVSQYSLLGCVEIIACEFRIRIAVLELESRSAVIGTTSDVLLEGELAVFFSCACADPEIARLFEVPVFGHRPLNGKHG